MKYNNDHCHKCHCKPCACCTRISGPTGPTGPQGIPGTAGSTGATGPGLSAENIPYPTSFGLKAWNFPPEGAGINDFFIQNDMTIYTTIVINTEVIVSQVAVLSNAFVGVIGPVYVGLYNYNRQLIARSGDVSANILTSQEPILSRLPLQSTVTLPPGKYYVAFAIELGGGQGFNLMSTINFMFLLQHEAYSNYYFVAGDLPNLLPFYANGYYGVAPFIALA